MSDTPGPLTNIGPKEINKRKIVGFVFLLPSLAFAAAIIFLGLQPPVWVFPILFVTLWIGSLGATQARERTCVRLAAKGACNMDRGEVKLDDPEDVSALKRKAWRIHLQSFLFALIVIVIIVI